MMWPLLCLVLVLAPSRTEQQIMDQLVGLESIIRASASTSAQRQEALRKRVEIRGQPSRTRTRPIHRAQWAGDQAEDLLSTGLSLDRLGLQVLYGYPTAAERELAEARISAGLAAVARAEEAVEQAIRDLEVFRHRNEPPCSVGCCCNSASGSVTPVPLPGASDLCIEPNVAKRRCTSTHDGRGSHGTVRTR